MMQTLALLAAIVAIAELGACVLLRGYGQGVDSEVKPHIVFVLADDLGYNSIGYNNAEVKTPTLDNLANEGVTLRSFYAAPICGPSRFSLLTGRNPWKSEAWMSNNFEGGIPSGTSLSYTMLPAALQAAGYKTHMVGKWHQGYYSPDFQPQHRGFDTFYGSLQGCVYHPSQMSCEVSCDNGGRVLDLMDDAREITVSDIDTSLVADDRYRIRAVELIRNHNHEQPMFLFVSFHHPHAPIDAPAQYSSQFRFDDPQKNSYFGMLTNLDDNVGEICKALVAVGVWEKTLFIFASDNGGSEMDIESQALANELNYPLKGFKGHVDEGAIRVPSFVSGGFLPSEARGLLRDGLTSMTDWYATLANVADAQVDTSGPFHSDSINNWEYISGASNESARVRLLQFAGSGHAIIEGKYKYQVRYDGTNPRLFDLEADPSTEHDIKHGNWEIVERLRAHFEHKHFQQFLESMAKLPECEDVGFSLQNYSENVCIADSDTFLRSFDAGQQAFIACWVAPREDTLLLKDTNQAGRAWGFDTYGFN